MTGRQVTSEYKGIMFFRYLCTAILLLAVQAACAQQFIGLAAKDYAGIQQVPYNPAWVNTANSGMEINVFGFSLNAGTNAYSITREWLTSFNVGDANGAVENKDYFKDTRGGKKHVWANLDILGPAVSFNFKEKHNIGVYTRMREIFRAGNMDTLEFKLLGKMDPTYYFRPLKYEGVGFSTHTFAEVGLSYGQEIKNDYSNIVRVGITVKYLIGFAAASVYTNSSTYIQADEDTTIGIKGDVTALYTYNLNAVSGPVAKVEPNGLAERTGAGSFGFDIGFQYEYHPNANPNEETPYLYSIAASITDIGGISYYTDTGSGSYALQIDKENIEQFNVRNGETVATYASRLIEDTLLVRKDNVQKFRMGLPTAFRFNADYNVTTKFNLGVNILLNMRGNGGDIYKPGYVSYFNITPAYGSRRLKLGIPFTFVGYQTVVIGAVLQAGPLYLGTNSLLSTLLSKNLRNADLYLGLRFKFHKAKRNYYTY